MAKQNDVFTAFPYFRSGGIFAHDVLKFYE